MVELVSLRWISELTGLSIMQAWESNSCHEAWKQVPQLGHLALVFEPGFLTEPGAHQLPKLMMSQ